LVLGYFAGLLLIINLNSKKARRWLLIYALILVNLFVWKESAGNSHDLKVVFFDVGQGDAALLNFPNGKTMLIDGGPRTFQYDAGKSVIARHLKREAVDKIDALVLSHAHTDHIGGFLHILRNFKVREVWDNGQAEESEIYEEYLSLIDSLNIKRRILRTGNLLEDFNPVKIFVLHPTEEFLAQNRFSINDGSLVLKISYGEVDFLFVGDVEINGELNFLTYDNLLASEVLKVGHHGSRTSSSQLLLSKIQPKITIISVGEFNKFNHPHREALQRLNAVGAKVLRTDQNAAVILKTDGKEFKQIHWK
ncbi:MAG: ComEC/Rec2 family competence protein, partial [bacterium]